MPRLKLMTVVGTRPEIIRLSEVIKKCDAQFEHILVHTGQNYDYELNQIFFDDLGLRKPDFFLNAAGTNAAQTIGLIIQKMDEVLDQVLPQALLVLGDTNSCLAALNAKRRHIPIFHMEAGNRCFDQRVPEETNRKIVDHIADINLPYSDIAREYLLREGIPPDRIVKSGSPIYEVLQANRAKIQKSNVLQMLNLEPNGYFVVSLHREENVEKQASLSGFLEALNAIATQYQKPIIFSTHPRTQKRMDALKFPLSPLIKMLKPLGFTDYVALQQKSLAVLSDSGTISEESSLLEFRAINLRQAHERPEAMEEAAVILAGVVPTTILQALELTLKDDFKPGPVADYVAPHVSDKMVRVIQSYTHYVRSKVWFEV